MEQNCEFIAAESGDRITWTNIHSESVGDCKQKLIADRMAHAVIDYFESIEIKEHDCKWRLLGTPNALHRLLELVHEKHSIGQASQGIMKCVMDQFFLSLLARADVLHLEDQICRVVLG